MKRLHGYLALTGLLLWSCSSPPSHDDSPEARAQYHMQLADSLESVMKLREAAQEYRLVAELYPNTSHYPRAVRNTALLYINPANPAGDDSLSLHWFQTYLTLPVPREERVRAEIYVMMLKRLTTLRKELNRQAGTIDSLQTLARRQSADLAARTKRLQELEAELKRTTTELERLRDVDARINRRKGGK